MYVMAKSTTNWDKLTEKERQFIIHYLTDCKFNGRSAAIKAGYSENSAASIASENLTKPKILKAINEKLDEYGLLPEKIRQVLYEMMNTSIDDFEPYILGDKTLKQLKADGVSMKAVQSAEISDKGKRSIKLADSHKTLELLIKLFNLIENKMTLDVKVEEKGYHELSDETQKKVIEELGGPENESGD